jgi:hypothetical protein
MKNRYFITANVSFHVKDQGDAFIQFTFFLESHWNHPSEQLNKEVHSKTCEFVEKNIKIAGIYSTHAIIININDYKKKSLSQLQ